FLVFLLRGKWRALGGFATAAALVVGISRIIVGPSFVVDYVFVLRNQEVRTPWGFVPQFMPNLRGLLQWALASYLDVGVIQAAVFVVSAGLGVTASWIILRSRPRPSESLYYAAAILTAGLVSYHLHMQDLTMAVLPILVLLDLAVRGRLSRASA